VANTTITARIAASATAGAVTGKITNTSTGATEKDVTVTGTVNAVVTPTIVISATSLDLGTTTAGTAGTAKTYTVSGSNLTAAITITAPTGVEISSNGTSFSNTLALTPTSGAVANTTISTRIAASAVAGPLTGKITNTSTGATEQDVNVTGTVNAVTTPTITVSATSVDLGTTTAGTAGTVKTYTVSGSNLTAAITITAPTGVEVSSNGTTFSGTLTLTPTSGAVANTTISTRIAASAVAGAVTGKITNTSTGATEQDVNVTGTVNAVTGPTLTVSATSVSLGSTTIGTAGATKTYTVSGSNLTTAITIAAPTGVEISSNGTTFSNTLTLTPTSGTVASTTISTRIAASAAVGAITGKITNTSTGATEQDVNVTGTVNAVATPAITISATSLDLGTTTPGAAGTTKTYTVSGTNLTAPITVTAPTGVEISSNGTSFSSTLTLTPTSGTVAGTTISARIAASAALGAVSGKITNTSTGATEQDVSVTGTVTNQFVVGDQTLSFHQNTFAVNLPAGGTASEVVAGSQAFFLQRDLGLSLSAGGLFQDFGGLGYKWLQGNTNAFGNSWYFLKPNGHLYAWDGTTAAAGSTLVASLDPVYFVYPDLLYNASQQSFDYVLKQRLGLAFAGFYYQNSGGQNEKWLIGNTNNNGNPWYFVTPAGQLYAWDGTASQATGTLLANLDPLFWAQPNRLFNAQANELNATIANNTLTVTTPTNFAGKAVVELNTTAPSLNHQIFTLTFADQAPAITITPSGTVTTKQGTPVSVTVTTSDGDGDTVNLTAVGGHLGFVLHQSLGLRLQGSLFTNYGGQNEEWLQSSSGNWYFIKPDGTLWKWDGTPNKATGTQTASLDPVYYYHPDLLYNPPSGDLAFALDQRLNLTNTGNLFLNYGGQNEKWLLGNDGWYFVKPDGTLWKWDGTANQATGTLQATLDPDYYTNIQRLYDAKPNQVAVNLTSHTLTMTPVSGFIGQFWVLVKANDGAQTSYSYFPLTVTA
jgi:hypothetical protein